MRLARSEEWRSSSSYNDWDLRPEFYVGVGFIYDRPVKVPGEVNQLAKNLQQNQFTIEQDNWIAWRDIGINIGRNEFFIDVASDPVLVADRAIEPLLDSLNKHGAEVEAAEIALEENKD